MILDRSRARLAVLAVLALLALGFQLGEPALAVVHGGPRAVGGSSPEGDAIAAATDSVPAHDAERCALCQHLASTHAALLWPEPPGLRSEPPASHALPCDVAHVPRPFPGTQAGPRAPPALG